MRTPDNWAEMDREARAKWAIEASLATQDPDTRAWLRPYLEAHVGTEYEILVRPWDKLTPQQRAKAVIEEMHKSRGLLYGEAEQISDLVSDKTQREIAARFGGEPGTAEWNAGFVREVERIRELSVARRHLNRRGTMRPYVKLWKDGGDGMGIETNIDDEGAFTQEFSAVLAEVVESGRFNGDWEFQISNWLNYYNEILCKLRGYKAEVQTETVMRAGNGYEPRKEWVVAESGVCLHPETTPEGAS